MLLREYKIKYKYLFWYFYNYHSKDKEVKEYIITFTDRNYQELFTYFLSCLNISCFIIKDCNKLYSTYYFLDENGYKHSQIYAFLDTLKLIRGNL